MKKLQYSMIFRLPISEEQEVKLNGLIQGMLQAMTDRMEKGNRKMESDPLLKAMFSIGGGGKMMKDRIAALLVDYNGRPMFWSYYSLEKVNSSGYIFIAPNPNELWGVPTIGKKLEKALGGEDNTLKFLHAAMKDIGVSDGEYKIVVSETDG